MLIAYRHAHNPSRLIGSRLALFLHHRMNRVNSRNDPAIMTAL